MAKKQNKKPIEKFEKGDRVRLSDLGMSYLASLPEAREALLGTVATKSRDPKRVAVVWDGQTTPQRYAAALVRRVRRTVRAVVMPEAAR